MTESSAQTAGVQRLRRWILTIGILLVLMFAAYWLRSVIALRLQNRPCAATWAEVQSTVQSNMQTEEYRKGGEYLKALANSNNPSEFLKGKKYVAIRLRVVIDFLRTVTPAQVEAMNDKLPYTQLSSKQQGILGRLSEYHQRTGVNPENSYIRLEVWRMRMPYIQISWLGRGLDSREVCYLMHHYWVRDAANNIRTEMEMVEQAVGKGRL